MSDSNRVSIRYIEEDTWGTTPATRAMQALRHTGESLVYNIENITSTEIRSDRQVTDLVQTGSENSGGINFELSYNAYDDFLEAALFSDWSADLGVSSTGISAAVTGAKLVSTQPITDFGNISAGQWIKVSGFTNTTLNTYYLVTSTSAATSIVVSPAPATSEVAGDTVTIGGSMLRNGTTEHYYSIERRVEDLSPNVYFAYTGMMVQNMNVSVQASSMLTGSFEFLGESATVATGSMSSGSLTSAATYDVMNAVANVGNILENNSAVSTCLLQGVDFAVANNLRGLKAIGALGNCDIGVGKIDVTGNINAYFLDKSLVAKYIAGTETSLSFRVTDGDSNAYIFTFHRIKFESDTINAEGQDSDVMENISWRAIRHATYDCTIQIDKFAG